MEKNKSVMIIGIIFLCFVNSVLPLENGESCRTPENRRGICINLKDCQPLLTILQQSRPLPASTIKFLRDSQCGGYEGRNPLVCCPDNQPPPPTSRPVRPTQRPVQPTQRPTQGPVGPTARPVQPAVIDGNRPRDVSRHRNVGLINSDECGRGSSERIFNGNVTGVFEYPWMVLLAYSNNNGARSFKCGGSLISEYYVLTAAHCYSNTARLKLVSVRLGEHDTNTNPDCEVQYENRVCAAQPQDIDVAETIVHPLYSTKKFINDIALIRLATPAIMTADSVRPICLPVGMSEQTRNHERTQLIVAGWGATEKNLPASNVLLKVKVPVVPTAKCAEIYKASFKFDVSSNQLCAGGSNKVQDSCSGDSGGPLKNVGLINFEPRFIQYGVVSYGHRVCGTEGVPGVYTRVGHYMEWILDNMRG